MPFMPDTELVYTSKLKLILFDIGGVCAQSPFQAILQTEEKLGIPPGWINFSISRSGPQGAWQKLERGEIEVDDAFFEEFSLDLHKEKLWDTWHRKTYGAPEDMPSINVRRLLNDMVVLSQYPDPYIFPALLALRQSDRFMLGALSNTMKFPDDHPLEKLNVPWIEPYFDFFVASAKVGMRKPQPEMYQYALEVANQVAQDRQDSEKVAALGWHDGIAADEVVFLDDIGENLKQAKRKGFRTIKVEMGKGHLALKELSEIINFDFNYDVFVPEDPLVRSTLKARL